MEYFNNADGKTRSEITATGGSSGNGNNDNGNDDDRQITPKPLVRLWNYPVTKIPGQILHIFGQVARAIYNMPSRSRNLHHKKLSKDKLLLTDVVIDVEAEKTLFTRFRSVALILYKLRARYNLQDSPELLPIPKEIRGFMNRRIATLILTGVVPDGASVIVDQVMDDMCHIFIQNQRQVIATIDTAGLKWKTQGAGDTSDTDSGEEVEEDRDDRVKMLLVNNDGSGEPASTQMDSYDYCSGETQWCFSQVKGALDDDVTEADIISCVEFNDDGDYLATGDKGGRVVIFQRDPISKNCIPRRGEYNVYSTFQSHEPEFDYLKSLEIEEKINKIRWLRRKNPAHFLLSTNDKTIKLWKVAEKEWRVEGFNLKEDGSYRDSNFITKLQVPAVKPSPLTIEASVRRVFANAHTYHINSISLNSDQETYLSADDLRVNLWNLEINDQSFNIVDIKPTNMEELTEVITAAEFHPSSCNVFVYSSSKGTIRLCDMRQNALCDTHSKLFDEPEDPTNRSFFSEIISSISDVKFSYSGRYMVSRDYLTVKVWDLHMESRPVECYPVHEYLRAKLCSLYENDCIFDKFECCWNGTDSAIMTGSYNNFFRTFDRSLKKDYTLEASREVAKPKTILKPRKVGMGGKRKKDEIGVDCLDFSKKILHTAWHPKENIIAVAATNNLFLFQDKC